MALKFLLSFIVLFLFSTLASILTEGADQPRAYRFFCITIFFEAIGMLISSIFWIWGF